jgi:hypothetical protein
MNTNISRISENVLFSLLLTAVVGWTAAQVVAGSPATAANAASVIAAAHPVQHS